jgi:hypothetical protein
VNRDSLHNPGPNENDTRIVKLQEQLREEIQQRVSKAGKGNSAPLDIEAFKAEARRRAMNCGRRE